MILPEYIKKIRIHYKDGKTNFLGNTGWFPGDVLYSHTGYASYGTRINKDKIKGWIKAEFKKGEITVTNAQYEILAKFLQSYILNNPSPR